MTFPTVAGRRGCLQVGPPLIIRRTSDGPNCRRKRHMINITTFWGGLSWRRCPTLWLIITAIYGDLSCWHRKCPIVVVVKRYALHSCLHAFSVGRSKISSIKMHAQHAGTFGIWRSQHPLDSGSICGLWSCPSSEYCTALLPLASRHVFRSASSCSSSVHSLVRRWYWLGAT